MKIKRNTVVVCSCGKEFPAYASNHKYCRECGEKNALGIKRRSAAKSYRNNPAKFRKRSSVSAKKGRSAARIFGEKKSEENRFKISSFTNPNLAWKVRIKYPFSYTLSKNALYSTKVSRGGKGYIYIREDIKIERRAIALLVRSSLRGIKVSQNKVWVSLFVEKPDHRGDAINTVDLVCDALQDALEIDDKWFCIRMVDWAVVKKDPSIYIEVGQEDVPDVQVCSYCGRLLEFEHFSKKKNSKSGFGTECRDCRLAK